MPLSSFLLDRARNWDILIVIDRLRNCAVIIIVIFGRAIGIVYVYVCMCVDACVVAARYIYDGHY